MQDSPDDQILPLALREDRIIVSADTDFGTLLAAAELSKPSFILFREPDLITAEDFLNTLLPSLSILRENWTRDVSQSFATAGFACDASQSANFKAGGVMSGMPRHDS